MDPSESQSNKASGSRKRPFTECISTAIGEVAELTKEIAHEVKETIVGREEENTEKKVAKAVENFEELKQQLADEEEELREIRSREEIAENTHNAQEYDSLKNKEQKIKKQELETEAQIAEAAREYKRLRTEQLHKKAEHEKIMQLTHPYDQKAIITDMTPGKLTPGSEKAPFDSIVGIPDLEDTVSFSSANVRKVIKF